MKKIIAIVFALIVIVVGGIFFLSYEDTQDPYVQTCDYSVPANEIPVFSEVGINFNHQFNEEKDLPFMASALIDIDNDGVDEIFIGGGTGQGDGLFKFVDGNFVDISDLLGPTDTKKTSTVGAASFDLDGNGFTDLLLARREGVILLKNDGEKFESTQLEVGLNEKSHAMSFTLGDYDKDGDADMFLCTYLKPELMEGQTIFNDLEYGSNSLLLRNDGDLKFTDVTDEAGLNYTHNTFQAIMVDIDDDNWLDLVIAYDTGTPRTYKNNQGESFTLKDNPLTGRYSYPMGIAVGDYNNDSKVDFFFSNTGSTVPEFLVKGDLREDQVLVTDWMLFKNDGDFKFTDDAKRAKVAAYEFSWGAIFEDFNLDGRQDLIVAENYVAFPTNKLFKLPCRLLIQRDDYEFAAVEDQAQALNKHYAITPLTSDFNNDGYPDLVYVNLNGPLRVLLNNGGNQQYLKVRFPERGAFLGSKVEVATTNGKLMSDVYIIGEGLTSDNTNVLTFGIDVGDSILSASIKYVDGLEEIIPDSLINTTYMASRGL